MSLSEHLAALANRTIQCLFDPFVCLLPGAAELVQRAGLCRDRPAYLNPQRLARGLVIVLPGIEGPSLYTTGLRAGLSDLPAAITVLNWAGYWPGMFAVFSVAHRRRRVGLLLGRIRAYRRDYPGRPVVLVGHSAGAAMAIHTAEALGPADPLTGVVAAATPLHRSYDLSAALAGVSRGLLACYSRLDYQLQLLVAVGGNFDRRWGPTAGRTGFTFVGDGKFQQIAWDRSMVQFGHWGGHVGWATAAWTRHYLTPIIGEWMG